MKKRVFGRKFSRGRKARTALFKSLVREFILRGQITTTQARAKAIKPVIDKLVTLEKQNTLAGKKALFAFLHQKKGIVDKLEEEVKSRFGSLGSGFTKQVRVAPRRGDLAPLVKILWSRKAVETKPKQVAK